jgi:hypothetical protein
MSVVHASLFVAGVYALNSFLLQRDPNKPGLSERGLVSIHRQRLSYKDVYRIKLRKDDVHILYEVPDLATEEDEYAYFPRKFISDEGIDMVRERANQFR